MKTWRWIWVALALAAGLFLAAGTALAGSSKQPRQPMTLAPQADGSYSSGWVTIAAGQTLSFTHNLGGDPALYAVELWFRDTQSGGFGINARAFGGLEVNGERFGAYWSNLTDSSIRIRRNPNDTLADQVYLRIWPPETPDYDSGWRSIAAGQALTLPHNLGGSPDDYLVGIKFQSNRVNGLGIHLFGYGGLYTNGALVGAAWRSLTNANVTALRFGGDDTVDQVRVFIRRSDPANPPSFDSGWVNLPAGATQVITHNLGGNPNAYILRFSARSAQHGINILAAGGLEMNGHYLGPNWENLNDRGVSVFRRGNDVYAEQARVRIWYPRKLFLPLVQRELKPTIELGYDDGVMDNSQSWTAGKGYAVCFTPPGGQAQLLTLRYYLQNPQPVQVHVWSAATHQDLLAPFQHTPTQDGWNNVDISTSQLVVNGDFCAGFWHVSGHDYAPDIGIDESSAGRSYEVDGAYWEQRGNNYMIRAVVVQP